MGCDLKAMDECQSGNIGGVSRYIYLIPEEEVESMPSVSSSPTNPGDTKKYTGTFTLVSTPTAGYFRRYRLRKDSGAVLDQLVGPSGSKSYRNVFQFSIDGNDAIQKEFADHLTCNCGFVAVVPDRAGVYHVIGNKVVPATLEEASGTTGLSLEENRGFDYTLQADTGVTAMVYDADNALPTSGS